MKGLPSKEEIDRIIESNCVDEFHKLDGVPGFCLRPMSFEEVGLILSSNVVKTCKRREILNTVPSDACRQRCWPVMGQWSL